MKNDKDMLDKILKEIEDRKRYYRDIYDLRLHEPESNYQEIFLIINELSYMENIVYRYIEQRKDDKEQSNADCIRSMTDEELAKFLSEFSACQVCKYHDEELDRCGASINFTCVKEYAEAIIGDWLKHPVEE